ncbi:patatin-like phospholipase family protein [Polaromonas sp.]|jgi:NTE family protein|uniref:patatin-like phospholipase family protein n=1 Tax=Polaromonas sp. TaxID=1869339 RepID=UPI002C7F09AB|nr:patatin-like phospholipase family protein [Polaromonas sp.]HQS33584.1 cyclic nucleotide-binding domain-containing protein [Polaromonas sp.]HQS92832.1 cyclic nucleotide-binding domain-containing protein [Polaromonas sp.]
MRHHHDRLLAQLLSNILGELDPAAMAILQSHLEWIELAAGEVLIAQGDPGDAMFLSISGRLRVYTRGEDGQERMLREVSRGEALGEMSLYTNEPRSATVIAVRNCVLVRLDKAAFQTLIASSSQVSVVLTRKIIKRLQTAHAPTGMARPVSMALIPITQGVDARPFGEELAQQLQRLGRVRVIDAASLDLDMGEPGLANSPASDTDTNRRIALYLDQVEADHDHVLLLADHHPGAWTQRCIHHSDELMLLANASEPPALHPTELKCLMGRTSRAQAGEILVLLHPADLKRPVGTQAWLARRPVTDHVHIRPTLARDMKRLARIQNRTAIGLVMAGGGARGLAQLGLYRALQEHGFEIDYVGGTSIGSVMAALVASDRPLDEVMRIARKAFSTNPTGDFNLIPLLSLISGKRLRRVIRTAAEELLGTNAQVEDLWKNYYCVATNYSQAREQILQAGDLVQALLASIAIPGALPPVPHHGDLLCDGGTFNNFPVNLMREMRGVGKVIGCDLSLSKPRHIDGTQAPSGWALLRDRLRTRAKRRYKFPSLIAYLLNVTILYSSARQSEAKRLTDLYFNPPLPRVGLLAWEKFDSIVVQGHAHGVEVLSAMSPASLQAFQPHAELPTQALQP